MSTWPEARHPPLYGAQRHVEVRPGGIPGRKDRGRWLGRAGDRPGIDEVQRVVDTLLTSASNRAQRLRLGDKVRNMYGMIKQEQ